MPAILTSQEMSTISYLLSSFCCFFGSMRAKFAGFRVMSVETRAKRLASKFPPSDDGKAPYVIEDVASEPYRSLSGAVSLRRCLSSSSAAMNRCLSTEPMRTKKEWPAPTVHCSIGSRDFVRGLLKHCEHCRSSVRSVSWFLAARTVPTLFEVVRVSVILVYASPLLELSSDFGEDQVLGERLALLCIVDGGGVGSVSVLCLVPSSHGFKAL
ncbi:hypothetical protein DFJ74DRAFT_114917 [Hyaloraphidium curvatum]|nr:hypothetical protein DFJ74DRAFT_114917 [Hyaloraphidium curvatum]